METRGRGVRAPDSKRFRHTQGLAILDQTGFKRLNHYRGPVNLTHKSHLLIRPKATAGEYLRVTPQTAEWEHLHFSARRLRQGETWEGNTGEFEYGFVILGGVCSAKSSSGSWDKIGRRPDVFHGMPYALYLPRH